VPSTNDDIGDQRVVEKYQADERILDELNDTTWKVVARNA
jgi:hypothetical protein